MAGRSRGTSRCGQRMAHGNGAAESERPQNNPGAGPARLPSTDSRCPWRLLRLLQPVWDPPPPLPPPAWWRDCPGWGGYGVVEAEAAVGGVWEVLKVVAGGGDLTDFAEAVAKALQHSVCASGRYRVSSDLRQRFGRGRRRLCRDLVGGLRPDEGPGPVVPVGRPGPNVAFEGLDGAVDSTLELLLRELGEPPLHQVQPRGSRRCEVQVEAWGEEGDGGADGMWSWLRRSGTPGIIGRTGWDRSRASICDFSSTQRTKAFSGGSR